MADSLRTISEGGALVSPGTGNALKKPFDGHRSGLAAFGYGLGDVRRKVSASQKVAHMSFVELEQPGNLRRVGISPGAQVSHP
jgi:hypothetical protein